MKKQLSEKYLLTAIAISTIVGLGSHRYYWAEWNAFFFYMGKWVLPILFPVFIAYSFLFFQKHNWSVFYFKSWAESRLTAFALLLISLSVFANFINGYFSDNNEILVLENITDKHCGSGRYSTFQISFYSNTKKRTIKMEVDPELVVQLKLVILQRFVFRKGF